MNAKQITAAASALLFASLMTAGTAMAHSNHDHRHLPVGWTFDKQVMNKVEKNLNQGTRFTGLSPLEQRNLGSYGIGVGNSFNTKIGNTVHKVTRASSGIRVEGPTVAYSDGNQTNLPLRGDAQIVRSSFQGNHPGHDHQHLSLAWVFNDQIERKIHNNLAQHKFYEPIGLSRTEQKILERYDIKVGNTFNASVDGLAFTVKRTSMGLQILRYLETGTTASINESTNKNF